MKKNLPVYKKKLHLPVYHGDVECTSLESLQDIQIIIRSFIKALQEQTTTVSTGAHNYCYNKVQQSFIFPTPYLIRNWYNCEHISRTVT